MKKIILLAVACVSLTGASLASAHVRSCSSCDVRVPVVSSCGSSYRATCYRACRPACRPVCRPVCRPACCGMGYWFR